MVENESDWEYGGDEMPDGDAHGELHGEALHQAERAAAARPGLAVRMGDVIERLMESATCQSRDPPDPEPETEENIGTEAVAVEANKAEPEWQAFPWEQPEIESEENDVNVQPERKRRAVVRPDPPSPIPIPLSPIDPNRAGPSGGRPEADASLASGRSLRRIDSSSDDESAEAGSAQMVADQETAHRREKRLKYRHAARQFIETMAAADGEADSEQELESDNESTGSDDSFIVGDDVCD